MNQTSWDKKRGGPSMAVAAMTLCTLASLPGCDGLGSLENLGNLIDTLGGSGSELPGSSGGSSTCDFRNDGECDDGRPGSAFNVCPFGTDPEDCDGIGGGEDCPFSNDGECDDGRPGALTSVCPLGTDSADCADISGGGGGNECFDNLDRFSGTYSLSVISRELGVQDYSTQGEDLCGPGEEFFGDLPTSATISVSGNSASISVNINSARYSASGTFQGPSAPIKPLVGGTFFESTDSSVTPGVNSCGTESPYISDSKEFSEDGGQTTLTVWVYGQKDAINVVAESFWIADGSAILSPCHGVIIFQGTK